MLTIQKRCAVRDVFDAELVMPFDTRQKSRLRTRTASGEEAGLFLPRGEILRDGDFLEADDGRVVKVRARAEMLLQVACTSPVQLARIAYHLGNRHVPLQIGDGWLRIADDYVLKQMVEGLGGTAVSMEAPFEPESGAYGGGNHHAETPLYRGIIHEYPARTKA